jgi:hypothetical protein
MPLSLTLLAAPSRHRTWIFWLNVPVGLPAIPLAATVLTAFADGAVSPLRLFRNRGFSVVNAVAPLAGLVLLERFGARTLIVTGQVLLAVALGARGRHHGRHRLR